MCLHNDGGRTDHTPTPNPSTSRVVQTEVHLTLPWSFRAIISVSAYQLPRPYNRVLAQHLYDTGSLHLVGEIPLTAVIHGVTLKGTLFALLLYYSAESDRLLSAILEAHLWPIFVQLTWILP
jgi:hypothetical protein